MQIQDILNDLSSKNDYLGMAKFLRGVKLNNKEQQDELNNQIAVLERYGGIANKLLSSQADPDIRNKLSFSLSFKGGSYGEKDPDTGEWKNPYAKTFVDYINSIGDSNNGNKAYKLRIKFDDEDKYKEFIDNSGLQFNTQEYSNSDAYLERVNGNPTLILSKNLLGDTKFFESFTNGLKNVHTNAFSFMSDSRHGFTISGLDKDDKFTGTIYDGIEVGPLADARSILDDVNNTYKQEVASKYDQVIPSGLQVSGYINDKQRRIVNMVGSGRLEREMANFMLKQIDDYYDNQLSGISLTGYDDVYATKINDETKNLMPINDSQTRSDLTDMIRAAAKENRVTVRAATAGGRVGASITIAAKLDTDGKPIGKYGGGVEIFVPGLFEKDARQVMDQDLDAKLLVEKSEHIAFNHSYFLEDGGKLCDFTGDGGAIYEDDLGRKTLTPAEVDDLMRQNEMIRGAAKQLVSDIDTKNLDNKSATELAQQYAVKIYSYMNDVPEAEIDTSKNNVPTIEGHLSINRIVQLIISQLKQ